jgi:hypothetical protein
VPLNGPLKSTDLILQQQVALIPPSHLMNVEKSGMYGQFVQVGLTQKQQKSQLIHNYIRYLEEFYEDYEIQPNALLSFYPKQI